MCLRSSRQEKEWKKEEDNVNGGRRSQVDDGSGDGTWNSNRPNSDLNGKRTQLWCLKNLMTKLSRVKQ